MSNRYFVERNCTSTMLRYKMQSHLAGEQKRPQLVLHKKLHFIPSICRTYFSPNLHCKTLLGSR